jgi:hypothetical protein
VPLVPQFVNSLHGDNTVKPTSDAARPVLGFEAGEHKRGCWKCCETFPAQCQHGLGVRVPEILTPIFPEILAH